jgi:hypothetical protein
VIYKRWDRLEIFWEDSHQIHGWITVEDADYKDDSSLHHQSLGYYIGETNKQFTICQSRKSDKGLAAVDDTHVNAVFSIPKSAIKRIRKIR